MFSVVYRTLAVTAILGLSAAPARPAEFAIANASAVPLRHLYISPCDAGEWGPDQLVEALPPSRVATISGLASGCYDIQFVVDPWNNCVIAGAALRGSTLWKVTRWTVFGAQSGDCSHVAGYVPAKRQPWLWPTASHPTRKD